MPRQPNFDPDVTRRDDGPYWAAALALAIRDGKAARANEARRNLHRLGYRLDLAAALPKPKGVARG